MTGARQSRGSWIAPAVGGVLIGSIAVFSIASLVASWQTERTERGWSHTLGVREELLRRFPAREANPAALRLESLAAGLGIDLAPRNLESRVRPAPESLERYEQIRLDVGAYVAAQLRRTEPGVEPAPGAVAAYLAEHRASLYEVVRSLTEDPAPQWELQLAPEASLPNLAGYLNLQRLLLADALAASIAVDRKRAWADMEASWQLNRALRDDPMLVNQVIAMAVTRMQAGMLWHLDPVPQAWRERLFEHDYRASTLTALGVEGWLWTQADPLDLKTPSVWPAVTRFSAPPWLPPLGKKVARKLWMPYARYCVADASDQWRRHLAELAASAVLCDYDPARRGTDLDIPIPRWSIVPQRLLTAPSVAVSRLARLEVDLEFTVKLLDLRVARRASGAWPRWTPDFERSSACPDDRWAYEVTPEGKMSLAFARDLVWPDSSGLILPTRYAVP